MNLNDEFATATYPTFLICETAAFVIAALTHLGVLVYGYEHRQARVAESVIAFVLLCGLALSYFQPAWPRKAAMIAQRSALFGTLVGVFTIIVGIGPRTIADIIYHIGIVALLI